MKGYYQLTTLPSGAFGSFYKNLDKDIRNRMPFFKELREFSQSIADNINKDYPGTAILDDNICYIKNEYWYDARSYVLANCRYELSRQAYNTHQSVLRLERKAHTSTP